MSYENGWKALNLEFSDKIPRTEYSTDSNWPLLQQVTGIDTTIEANRPEAVKAFRKTWDYSLNWSVLIGSKFISQTGGRYTSMGHAVYQNDGSDYNDHIVQGFSTPEEAIALDPCKEYGEFDQQTLIDNFENHYRANCERLPDEVNMSGIYITMFSGLIEIFGFDTLLLTMGMYEKEFGKVIEGYYHWIKQFFDAYAKTDIPVMMVHDDLCWTEGPVTHPEWYRTYIFPYMKKLIQPVKEAGKKILFTSDGTIDEFFGDIVDCGADMLFMEPTSDIKKFAHKYGDRCGFVGGMDCRGITYCSNEEIEAKVKSIMEFGRQFPGFMLAVGNHLPPDTPVEKALFYNEMYEKHACR
jgi:hypothetical protein